MAAPDVALLQATIAELKAELSRARVQAEVFRALYERQAVEIDGLLAPPLGDHPLGSRRGHLRVVADGVVVGRAPELLHGSGGSEQSRPATGSAGSHPRY